ncbi:MAG: tetratricopeptide repeat protein [Candidatus Sericytochromatia bacterium]|nr:tetratricopeptide repeat protein [Candidatus Sericytochromatia bacterium]
MRISANWLETAVALLQAKQLPKLVHFAQTVLAQAQEMGEAGMTDQANAYYFLGLAWSENEPDSALNAYLQALKLCPKHPDYLRQTGHLLRNMGQEAKALRYYQQAVKWNPNQLSAWFNLLQMLFQMQSWQELLKQLELALVQFPEDPHFKTRETALRISALHGLAESALKNQNYTEALSYYQQAFKYQRGIPWTDLDSRHTLLPSNGPLSTLPAEMSRDKWVHDLEQWIWLDQQGLLPKQAQACLPDIQDLLSQLTEERCEVLHLSPKHLTLLKSCFNAPVFWPQTAFIGPVLNPELNFEVLENNFLKSSVPLLWFDHFLSPEALTSLRQFCLGATLWRDYYANQGYLGAFMDDGFVSPLLLKIAEALQLAFPKILGDKALHYLWGFKYGSSSQGIRLHADQAQINLNFWLTPDCANLNPAGGGLQVYDCCAPSNWNFQDYNDQASQARIQAYLLHSKAQMTQIPHRQNRAVLFNSQLFHRTDPPQFKQGYENRRINVTMLFG